MPRVLVATLRVKRRRQKLLVCAAICIAGSGCAPRASSTPTASDARAFLDTANATSLKLGIQASQAGWVQQTYITDDTEALAARANQAANDAGARFASMRLTTG